MEKSLDYFEYSVKISFDNCKQLPKMPMLNNFLGALEDFDKSVCFIFGLDITHQWTLKDMGPRYFYFTMTAHLNYPKQLGDIPLFEAIILLMKKVRESILSAVDKSGKKALGRIFASQWHEWIIEMRLHEGFIFNPPDSNQIDKLLDILRHTLSALGKGVRVEI